MEFFVPVTGPERKKEMHCKISLVSERQTEESRCLLSISCTQAFHAFFHNNSMKSLLLLSLVYR